MMKLRFFGVVKDAVGRPSFEMSPEGIGTVEALERRLLELHPGITRYRDFMVFLKDSVVMDRDEAVEDGDEITVMIPVSGG